MVGGIQGAEAVRWFIAVTLVLTVLAGCTTDDESTGTGESTTPGSSSTSMTSTTATTIATTSTSTTSTSITTTSTLPPVGELETGLLCRDLADRGYDYEGAVAYWTKEGTPERMDADGNGIPCETVYLEKEVLAFWGDPLPTTTAPPATVVTIVYAPDDPYGFAMPDSLPGSDEAHGSGCAPGTNTLPDGIWFGYVTDRSADSLDFDLACIWTGDAAYRRTVEAGEEPIVGFWISNVNPKIRTARIASGTTVYHLAPSVAYTPLSYPEWRRGRCHGMEARSCPVWLYVNGGRVTSIVEQFFA